jgi:hypothetical protein
MVTPTKLPACHVVLSSGHSVLPIQKLSIASECFCNFFSASLPVCKDSIINRLDRFPLYTRSLVSSEAFTGVMFQVDVFWVVTLCRGRIPTFQRSILPLHPEDGGSMDL